MSEKIQKICDSIVDKYKQDRNVLGILLFGSVARNRFDKYSDIDIYILLKERGKYSRRNFVKDGIRVDIIMDSVQQVVNYLTEDKNSVRRNTSHMLAYGQILFAKGGQLEKIQNIAKKNLCLKTKYSKTEILMHKYSIDDFWGEVQRDLRNKDYVAWSLDSQLLINNIIELFLKINGDFFRQSNDMINILKRIDKKFSHYLVAFYKENSFQKRNKILAQMVKYIYTHSGGPLPKEWVIIDK